MEKGNSITYQEAVEKLSKLGQEHILRFWDELDKAQRQSLLQQIESLEERLLEKFTGMLKSGAAAAPYKPGTLEPLSVIPLPQTTDDLKARHQARQIGEDAIRQGQVGTILVAGGQGTRLGFEGPKGTFPVGPITQRTLFQYHTEKLLALERKFQTTIPLYIMTSETNDQQTREFFAAHNYFGKSPDSIIFFRQGMLPPIDPSGRLFLEKKWKISMSPDGHGGLLRALQKNHLVDDMRQRGVQYLFYFQVDNALVIICDPVFIGYHILYDSEMSAKTVYKRSPEEKLGNIGRIDGKVVTIEYTELSHEEKYATNADGRLKFGQGSIAIHVFSRSFFERLTNERIELPYHLAFKKITYIDEKGAQIKPDAPNGYKFEQFIFDAFPYARNVMVMETDRKQDFSAIKNAAGEDSPETARRDLSNLFADWLEKAGVAVQRDKEGHALHKIEISPLFAIDAEELSERLNPIDIRGDLLLENK